MNNITGDPVYLLVNDIKDICKLKGHMQLSELLQGVRIPKKRKIEETLKEVIKFITYNTQS